jgi:hypothetical protein
MSYSIKNYINSISRDVNDETVLTYYGDGQGDFEKSATQTDDECLKKYIMYCNEQVKIAKAELKRRSKKSRVVESNPFC